MSALCALQHIGSLIAGFLARKAFDGIWSAIDDEGPPEAGEEREPLARVVLAAVLQAAVFAGTRGAVRPPGAPGLPRSHRNVAWKPGQGLTPP